MSHQTGQGDSIQEAMSRFPFCPVSSYLVIASLPPSESNARADPSASLLLSGPSTALHPTPSNVVRGGRLQDGGLEGVKGHLAEGESVVVLVKFRADYVLIQCIGEDISAERTLKAHEFATLLLSHSPTNTTIIRLTRPSQLTGSLIRSKISASTGARAGEKVGYMSSIPSSDFLPDVPQDASNFDDSPLMGSFKSEATRSSPNPDTPSTSRESQSFFDSCYTYDDGLTPSMAFMVNSNLDSSSPKLNEDDCSPRSSHHELEVPFPMPPERGDCEGRRHIAIPTPVQEESGEEWSSLGSKGDGCGDGGSKNYSNGTASPHKPLPSAPQSLYNIAGSDSSLLSSNLSWVLESRMMSPVYRSPAKYIAPKVEAVKARGEAKHYSSAELERERLAFLLWQREQEAAMLVKEKEREAVRRMADEAKRERVLRKLMKEQQTWAASNQTLNQDSFKGGSGLSPGSAAAPAVLQQKGASSSSSSRKKGRQLPLSPPPSTPPPKSPALSTVNRVSIPGGKTQGVSAANQTPRLRGERKETGQSSPIITLEGHIRLHTQSQGSTDVSKKASKKTSEEVGEGLEGMPPFLASIEMARRKAKKMEEEGLHGESWLTMRNRERLNGESQVLLDSSIPVGSGWRLTEVEGVKVDPPTPEFAALQAEALLAHQQHLAFQMTDLLRRERELNTAEGLQRAKWAREQVSLQRLDAFERSKKEASEQQRRAKVGELRKEEEERKKQLAEQQAEAKARIEEEQLYRSRMEKAKQRQREKMEEEEEGNKKRREQAREKARAKAERREAMWRQMEKESAPVLAQGIITLQIEEQLKRRQRKYELHRHGLLLFPEANDSPRLDKSPKGEAAAQKIALKAGSIVSLNDAFEELQAPHSFCLRYYSPESDQEQTLLAYTTTEEDKERLIVGLALLAAFSLDEKDI